MESHTQELKPYSEKTTPAPGDSPGTPRSLPAVSPRTPRPGGSDVPTITITSDPLFVPFTDSPTDVIRKITPKASGQA
jgi:hypothetical protein